MSFLLCCRPNDDGRTIAREILHHEVGHTRAAVNECIACPVPLQLHTLRPGSCPKPAVEERHRLPSHGGRCPLPPLQKLLHAHVVRFRECFAAGPYLCIAMELVPGGDLLELVNSSRGLAENEARYLFQQLVGAAAQGCVTKFRGWGGGRAQGQLGLLALKGSSAASLCAAPYPPLFDHTNVDLRY